MVLLDFSRTPLGKGERAGSYVARFLEVVAASGLDYRLHALGTTLEGELREVLDVVRCRFEGLQADCDRISCSIKIDYHKGPGGRLDSKVQKVQELVVTVPSRLVRPPLVADAPAALECKMVLILPLKDLDGRPTPSTLVLGQVVGVYIAAAFLKDGLFDPVAAGTIARCGYRGDYTQVTSLFEMLRPSVAETAPARSS